MRKTSDEKVYIHGKMMTFSDLFFEYCKIEDENEKLKTENKELKDRNANLRLNLATYDLPEVKKVLIDWRTGELDKKFKKLENENKKLKGIIDDPIKENEEYFEIKMYKYKRKYEICKKKLELIMLHLEEVKEVLNEKDC